MTLTVSARTVRLCMSEQVLSVYAFHCFLFMCIGCRISRIVKQKVLYRAVTLVKGQAGTQKH